MAGQSSQYLESKVLTAPPQRLHLMLIEGAIRFGRQAEASLRAGELVAAAAPLMRTIDIVGELLAAVRTQRAELNTCLADFYWFLFRRLSETKINGDVTRLTEAIKLLEFERETWQMVCEKAALIDAGQKPVEMKRTQQDRPSRMADTYTKPGGAGGISFKA